MLPIPFLAPRIASFALQFGPPKFFAVYLLTFCSFVGLGRKDKHLTIPREILLTMEGRRAPRGRTATISVRVVFGVWKNLPRY